MEVRRCYLIGRSLAITLPKYYAKHLKLNSGDLVYMTLADRILTIKPLVDVAGPDKQMALRLDEPIKND